MPDFVLGQGILHYSEHTNKQTNKQNLSQTLGLSLYSYWLVGEDSEQYK